MSSKIRFAYGESNFEKVIQKQAFFVDKTPYLEKLEDFGNDRVAFLRPRRMGKSLFVSILEYYYGKEHKDKFDRLFGKLYIGQHPTPLANTYAVLKMDFSGIDTSTEERAYQGFLTTIKLHITEFNKSYHCFGAGQSAFIQAQDNPELVMKAFFSHYRGEKIYLIIDEYDHFTNELLLQDLHQFQRAVTKNGYVRKFYETIKIATQQAVIDRVFITGVSPITLDALTSGFNILSHLTTELLFHDMMGFTEEQVSEVLYAVLEDKSRHPEM
ncbi:MAG: AAA family ATPase [Lewinella sp.]|nr:AAA family ATPase [Lewinella sp.]